MALLQLRHLTPHSLPFTPKLRHFHFSALKFPRFSFSASASTTMAKKVLVPIANGTEPMEAVITIDVLRRSGADVTVASVEKQLPVDACHGVKIVADALVVDCTNTIFDLIALPGGMPGATNLKNCGALESVVKKQAADGLLYAAICASPAVALGSWGLLKGLKATAFPAMCNKLSDQSFIDNRVVVDGNLITSRGPGTAMEFALGIVEKFFGRQKALELAKVMLFVRQ
ncbi:hypothetical protein QUC31_002225 [Theobroma cacao]